VKSTHDIKEGSAIIDMLTTNPAAEVNPYKDFYHCMEKAISLYEHKLFAYSPVKGMPELITALKKHLTNYQIFAREEDIFITSGAQQALFILTAMDFPNGKNTILVEQPTYHVMLDTIKANKVSVLGIERTADGLDFAKLEKIFAQNEIKFFYLMPRFQNPTGFSYDNTQKRNILHLAQKYQVYLVEDDYIADLDLNSKNDPIAAFDTENTVIYVQSFSKTLLPGLRLGMAMIPQKLQQEFLKTKNAIDLNSSVFSQGALEIYLKSHMYENHIQRTKAFYKNKMDILSKECKKELDGLVRYFIP
jgi:DNA-binding transcriptional MocR family regulator